MKGCHEVGEKGLVVKLYFDLYFSLSLWWMLHYLKELEYLNLESNKRLTGQVCESIESVCMCEHCYSVFLSICWKSQNCHSQ